MSKMTFTKALACSSRAYHTPVLRLAGQRRWQSRLTSNTCNKHIYVLPDERSLSNHLLSLLSTVPANPRLAIGTTSELPPTPSSFQANPRFMPILQSVIAEHASKDPVVISNAQAYASTAGSSLGSGGAFFGVNQPQTHQRRRQSGGGGGTGGDGAGGASAQGGAGGAGRGGYVHVWDARRPPDFGRVPDPEDIFGSLEVDGSGNFVDGHGRYQESGTYRLLTPDGVLGLSDYLRERLVERLEYEAQRQEIEGVK